MELSKYKACICEGSAETAIIDILLDNNIKGKLCIIRLIAKMYFLKY